MISVTVSHTADRLFGCPHDYSAETLASECRISYFRHRTVKSSPEHQLICDSTDLLKTDQFRYVGVPACLVCSTMS